MCRWLIAGEMSEVKKWVVCGEEETRKEGAEVVFEEGRGNEQQG